MYLSGFYVEIIYIMYEKNDFNRYLKVQLDMWK